jgi:hypothetical protein
MLSLRVSDGVYGLEDESASELVRRLGEGGGPPLVGGEPEPGSFLEKLREGYHSQEPVDLDSTEIVIVGIVLEAWLVEAGGDLPGDVEELRHAISAAVRGAT